MHDRDEKSERPAPNGEIPHRSVLLSTRDGASRDLLNYPEYSRRRPCDQRSRDVARSSEGTAHRAGRDDWVTPGGGAGVYELEKGTVDHGVALERFEDCIFDIDAWISLARDRGYENVILEGHSYGTEKSVYYMNKGTYRDNVKGVILFGFSDNVGSQFRYEATIGRHYLDEARELVAKGDGRHLLNDLSGLYGELADTGLDDGQIAELSTFLDNRDYASFRPLKDLIELLDQYSLAEFCDCHPGIVRGLAYYSGTVFEI